MQILEDKSSFSKYRREKAAKDQSGSHSKRKEKIQLMCFLAILRVQKAKVSQTWGKNIRGKRAEFCELRAAVIDWSD